MARGGGTAGQVKERPRLLSRPHEGRTHPPGRTALPRPAGTAAAPPSERDTALDLVRGLAIAILVVNHIHLDSPLGYVTGTVLSAAEVLVAVSGVVAGMVFGRRWVTQGARVTSRILLARARKLYIATVCVIGAVGGLVAAPWLDTGVVTASPRMAAGTDLYAFDGTLRTIVAVFTLEAGPWQFSILGLFIVLLALTPALLWALDRGWWLPVLCVSWAVLAVGRTWDVDVLPTQSERAFPILVWQALFVHGLVVGFHRRAIADALSRHRRQLVALVGGLAVAAVALRLQMEGLAPIGLDQALGYAPADWELWQARHFDKTTLDAARVAVLTAIGVGLYLTLRAHRAAAERMLGWLLLPLGRNSFYVFIMHVFVCLAVALLPGMAGAGPGPAASLAAEVACLALLWAMVRRRFLFSIVPR